MARGNIPPKGSELSNNSMAELLTPEEQVELARQAKEEALGDMKENAKKQFLLEAKKREMRRLAGVVDVTEQMQEKENVSIDLGTSAPYVMLDGKVYWHGFTYPVTRAVAESLKDIMFQTHRHEAEVHGENTNTHYGRKHINTRVSPRGAVGLPH